jgi:aspartate carbamoyltransferase regulatory subunit
MNVDSIINGIVIDHITAGKGMELYKLMKLGQLDCSVALINHVNSRKMGKKDIIKIDSNIEVDMDILGYVDPNVTVNIIKDGKRVEKKRIELPDCLRNVILCKNPRCITTIEQELPHIFKLTDRENRVYRCLYCETKANGKQE